MFLYLRLYYQWMFMLHGLFYCMYVCVEWRDIHTYAWISDSWTCATAWQFIWTKKIFYCACCLAALLWSEQIPVLLLSTWLHLLPSARWQRILWEAASRCPRCRCAWYGGPGTAGTSASPLASGKSHLFWTATAGLEMLCREWEED